MSCGMTSRPSRSSSSSGNWEIRIVFGLVKCSPIFKVGVSLVTTLKADGVSSAEFGRLASSGGKDMSGDEPDVLVAGVLLFSGKLLVWVVGSA